MKSEKIARRMVLKAFAVAPVSTFIKQMGLPVAGTADSIADSVSAAAREDAYIPKFFNEQEYATLRSLCQTIIPSDEHCGGATEAAAPEFIDLLTSESEDFQRQFRGGMLWLNATCQLRYKNIYLECSAAQQEEILDLIAYRMNGEKNPRLMPGIMFFALLRELTVDGYFTSKIGIAYLGYVGNTFLTEFPGCAPIPD